MVANNMRLLFEWNYDNIIFKHTVFSIYQAVSLLTPAIGFHR